MDNLNNYLQNNISNPEEIKFTNSFYKNFNELKELYNSSQDKVLRCQGRYNSKICFIFKDSEHFKRCSESLQKILPAYGIKLWDVLILFSDSLEILLKELIIVNPSVIYIFDDNDLNNKIINISKNKIVLNYKTINVNNIDQLLINNVPSKIFDLFQYLVTYNS